MKHIWTVVCLIAALVVGAVPAHAGGSAPGAMQTFDLQTQQQLNATFTAHLHMMNVHGGVAGIWIPGRGRWEAATGIANPATGQRMSLDDYMRVGSVTKSMTLTAILMLMDERKLALDDPISKYVPGVPNGQNITLRMMGSMRSGLFNYTRDKVFGQRLSTNPYSPWTPEQLITRSFANPPVFPPNAGFDYSNTNTVLLGMVVRKVSGDSLAHFLRTRIFEPLGMRHTWLATNGALPAPYAHGFTDQTIDDKVTDATHWNPSWGWAAGAAVSTLGDLMIWAQAVGTGKLISAQAQRDRLRFIPVAPGAPGGYGLAVGSRGGWILHNGNLPGYSSFFAYLPSIRAVLAVSLTTDITYKNRPPGDVMAGALSQIVTPGHDPATDIAP